MSYASNRTPAVARGAVAGTGARQRDVRARSVAPSSAAASGETSVRLSSSAAQPMVGLGTWQAPKGQVREAVKAALPGKLKAALECGGASKESLNLLHGALRAETEPATVSRSAVEHLDLQDQRTDASLQCRRGGQPEHGFLQANA